MSSHIRRLIFLTFIIVFIILTPLLLLYYSGYQWDWKRNKIVKTGAFLIESEPRGAFIFLNGALLKKKTPSLINNLLPNEYLIEVKKQDYYDWRKTLNVESKKVSFAQNIQLFLKNPSLEIVSKTEDKATKSAETAFSSNINCQESGVNCQMLIVNCQMSNVRCQGFNPSPDKKKILFWTDFELWIYDLEKEKKEILGRYSKEIIDALWHSESNWIILAFSDSIQAIELDNRDGKNAVELIKAEKVDNLTMMKKGEVYFRGQVAGKERMLRVKIQ